MKINLKNVALVLLAVAGGVGASVAAISSASKTKSSSVANMSDSSIMMSMQPDTSSCEMCSSGSFSKCTDDTCPHHESMMSMTKDSKMSMDGTMSKGDTKATMGGEKMPEVSMATTMSPSMSDKTMTPSMGSAKMADAEQMTSVAPKM